MMRKRWLFAPALAALMLMGLMAGAALAQDQDVDENEVDNEREPLAEKVVSEMAERLGVSEEQAEEALIGVMGHFVTQHLEQTLDQLVELEHLSQDEADEVLSWYEDRPDAADRALFYATLEGIERKARERFEMHMDWGGR